MVLIFYLFEHSFDTYMHTYQYCFELYQMGALDFQLLIKRQVLEKLKDLAQVFIHSVCRDSTYFNYFQRTHET